MSQLLLELPKRLLANSATDTKRIYLGKASAQSACQKSRKKVVLSDDNLSVKYFIHPHSMHTSEYYRFHRPVEVGSILSESDHSFTG